MNWQTVKKELLKNSGRRLAYTKATLAESVGAEVVKMRGQTTQTELARKIGTKQPAISRLERGHQLPSLTLLNEIADKFDKEVFITFVNRDLEGVTSSTAHPNKQLKEG